MKRLLLIICLGLTMSTLTAQDSASVAENPWKKGALVGLNFSQTYLDNWQGGGQSAISGTALVNLFANYKKDKWTWDNTFDGAYGLTRIGGHQFFKKLMTALRSTLS
jgi:hypothetical protein